MYTGENTLSSISAFLAGYECALHNVDDTPARVLPREFHDWVAYRLHFYEATSGWCNMICERTSSNQQAIDRFFALLDEYEARKPHLVAKLIGHKRTYTQSKCHHEADQIIWDPPVTREYPDSISLVTYTDDPGFFAYSDDTNVFPGQGYFPNLRSFELYTGANRSLLTIIDQAWL